MKDHWFQRQIKRNLCLGCYYLSVLNPNNQVLSLVGLETNLEFNENMAAEGPSSASHSQHRLLRCFSNSFSVTEDEIKRFIDVSTLVTNDKAKHIFRHFLEIGRRNDTSLALTALNCYELADNLLTDSSIRSDDNYNKIKEILPSYVWEKGLDEVIKSNNDNELNEYLERLMAECKHRIETHQDFDRFKKMLLDKLKSCKC